MRFLVELSANQVNKENTRNIRPRGKTVVTPASKYRLCSVPCPTQSNYRVKQLPCCLSSNLRPFSVLETHSMGRSTQNPADIDWRDRGRGQFCVDLSAVVRKNLESEPGKDLR